MYQDIYRQVQNVSQHKQRAPRYHASHWVQAEPDTKLFRIVGKGRFRVNSFHHQAVHRLAPGFILSGVSSDGLIEAFESEVHPFAIGVQWHPEDLYDSRPEARALFDAFIDQCKKGSS